MLYELKLRYSAAEVSLNLISAFGTDSYCERTAQMVAWRWRGPCVHHNTVAGQLAGIGKVENISKWVPHEFTDEQRLARFDTCFPLLVRFKNEPFLRRIMTVDEKWVLYDNRKRRFVWVEKDFPLTSFSKPGFHLKNVTLTLSWCCKVLIHYSHSKVLLLLRLNVWEIATIVDGSGEYRRVAPVAGQRKAKHLTNHIAKIDPFTYRRSPSPFIFSRPFPHWLALFPSSWFASETIHSFGPSWMFPPWLCWFLWPQLLL